MYLWAIYSFVFFGDYSSCTKSRKKESSKDNYLLSFLIRGYLGKELHPLTEKIFNSEMSAPILFGGKEISLRFGMVLLSAESDRKKTAQARWIII